jgi:hypothetical protein
LAFDPEAKKGRARKSSTEDEENPSATAGLAASQQGSVDVTSQLTVLFQELLLRIHELSFEVATLEDEQLRDSPLVQKALEVLKVTKKINEFIKMMARPVAA